MKRIFIIPGFFESSKDKAYQDLFKLLKSKGFDVKIIDIEWKQTVFDQWVEQFWEKYKQDKNDEIILLGFSYGAMIALAMAAKINPKKLILCSMSPSFKEDIPYFKKSWLKSIGKKRTGSFSRLSFAELAKNIKCETILLIGEKEAKKYPLFEKRIEKAHEKIKSELIRIKNTDHNIGQREYLEAIDKLFFCKSNN